MRRDAIRDCSLFVSKNRFRFFSGRKQTITLLIPKHPLRLFRHQPSWTATQHKLHVAVSETHDGLYYPSSHLCPHPSDMNELLSNHTPKVRLIQSKLLLLRIAELTTPKPPDPSHIPKHHIPIYKQYLNSLQASLHTLSTLCKTPSSTLETHLEIHTRCTVFLLVYTLHLIARHPGTEKAFTMHRVTAFLHTQAKGKQYRLDFMAAVRLCTRDILSWFDYAVSNVFWAGGNAIEQRLSFIDQLLPHTICDTEGSTCTICCSDYELGCVLRRFSGCGHLFHAECLDRWLLGHQETCPLCREPLNPLLVLSLDIQKLNLYTCSSLKPTQQPRTKEN